MAKSGHKVSCVQLSDLIISVSISISKCQALKPAFWPATRFCEGGFREHLLLFSSSLADQAVTEAAIRIGRPSNRPR